VLTNLESRGRKSKVLIQLLDAKKITNELIPKASLWGKLVVVFIMVAIFVMVVELWW
jgi:hypothetical protein